MAYIFNTPDQQQEMLQTIGVDSLEELFQQVPDRLRLQDALQLPEPLCEPELEHLMRSLAGLNSGNSEIVSFLGGGVYDHYVPSVVDEIASRNEFYTAYTPYQAEASQGSLQAFFEYQTLICQLTGMDVSNASLYEGGTSVSEAAFMAMRITRRHERIVVLGSIHPEFLEIVNTYTRHLGCEVVVVSTPEGAADPAEVEKLMDDRTACLIIQHPNFFGHLEEARRLTDLAHQFGALAVVCFDPISLGLLERPGEYGVDIAVAEGQSLGIPQQFGGPFLGIMTCRQKFVRQMPGRLIGETTDRNGKRCFVLNLQAREQHIRREKATSNICTNQGLLALRATVYLALLGKEGLREVAELCCQKAHYAAERLAAIDGVEMMFNRPFFKEFTLRCRDGAESALESIRNSGLDAGPALNRFSIAGINNQAEGLLVAVTENRTRDDIDELVSALED